MIFSEFKDDVSKIPENVSIFINSNKNNFTLISEEVIKLSPTLVLIAGHGSSMSAGKYLSHIIKESLKIPSFTIDTSDMEINEIFFKGKNILFISISKSGETIDVVEATKMARHQGYHTLSITNHAESSLAKITKYNINFGNAPETCAAFSSSHILSLAASLMLVAYWGKDKEFINQAYLYLTSIGFHKNDFYIENMSEIKKETPVLIISEGIGMACAEEIAIKFMEMYRVHASICSANAFWHASDSHILENDYILFISTGDKCSKLINVIKKSSEKLKPKIFTIEKLKEIDNERISYYTSPITCTFNTYINLHEFEPWTPYPCSF